jgi:hypothetical protein
MKSQRFAKTLLALVVTLAVPASATDVQTFTVTNFDSLAYVTTGL